MASSVRLSMAGVLVVELVLAAVALAVEPIPARSRISASIVETLSAPAESPMHMPTDVAVDRAGRVFVADGANNRIVVFKPDGAFDRAFSAVGEYKLNRPVGIHIDPAGRLWIADSGNRRVLIVDSEAQSARPVELPVEKPERFEPTDIAVTADGRRAYIVDNETHRIIIRDNETGRVESLGRFGEGIGQFRWPFMVDIAPDGYVYVTEVIGARAQRLSPAQRWAGQVGRWGVELGQLYRPKGVVVDDRGRVWISDSTTCVVQVFGPRGAIEGVLTGEDHRPLKFEHPMGMAFDARGRLHVVELKAHRVAIVQLPPEYTPAPRPAIQPDTQPATRPATGGGGQ